jgi:hypothetical protein
MFNKTAINNKEVIQILNGKLMKKHPVFNNHKERLHTAAMLNAGPGVARPVEYRSTN